MQEMNQDSIDQIFHESLTAEELSRLGGLIENSKHKQATIQQLALDASRLLTASEERLENIKDAGFFKRCYYAFTGKNQEVINQNSVDLISMQHFAWHYLKELQEQNLIQLQSIATIRNNLNQVYEFIDETRCFLDQVVDKIMVIDSKVEMNDWRIDKEVNKRKFKSYPKTFLILYLVYDFLKSHRDADFSLKDINHIILLLDGMGVDCDEEISFLDFTIELIVDIGLNNLENYRNIIDISYESYTIDDRFILENISSQFFDSLYFLSKQYSKIYDLTSDGTICDSDEKFRKIVSKFFGEEFDFLDSTYSIREIIEEIIGSSKLAINIYKEQNGICTEIKDELLLEQDEAIIQEPNTSYDNLIENLNEIWRQSVSLSFKSSKLAMDTINYSVHFDWSDPSDGFFSKIGSSISGAACSMGRKSCTSDLNDYKKSIEEFISNNRCYLNNANSIMSNYHIDRISFINKINSNDVDLDTSATNENWSDQHAFILNQITETFDSFLQACDDAQEQLKLFRNHQYDKSIVQLRMDKISESEELKKLEKINSKVIHTEDDMRISIDWKKINFVCPVEDIRFIEAFNGCFLIIDNNKNLYTSENGENWDVINMSGYEQFRSIDEIKIIDNICFIFPNSKEDGFLYSYNGTYWQVGTLPSMPISRYDGIYPTCNLIKLNDLWLWRFTKQVGYEYIEKGFIFDSTEKSSYEKSLVMCSSSLDGEWQKWDNMINLDEGQEVKNIYLLPESNIIILLAEYDYLYTNRKKKIDAKPIIYYFNNNRWRTCSWNLDRVNTDILCDRINDAYLCTLGWNNGFQSLNGFEWEKLNIDFSIEKIMVLGGLHVYSSSNNLYFSTDINIFYKMILDDGQWKKFALNNQSMLAIHSPSRHEDFVMLGEINIQQ